MEAAKRLADDDPIALVGDDGSQVWQCGYCFSEVPYGPDVNPLPFPHKPDCPILAMPRIVAALEAAEQVTDGGMQWTEDDNGDYRVPADDLRALVAAMRGEKVTS